MTVSLDGPKLKLRRAGDHFDSLYEFTEGFLSRERQRITPKFNAETSRKDFWLNPAPTPVEWGPMIGDVLYNCRSSLDQLANQLAGGDPDDKVSSFPIFDDSTDFADKGKRRIVRMPDLAQTFIEDMQPYKRTKKPKNDLLWLLNELCNMDKHRQLHVTAVISAGVGWFGDYDVIEVEAGPLESYTKLFSVPVTGPEMPVDPQVHLRVAFGDIRRLGMPLEIDFLVEVMSDIEVIFAECVKRGFLRPWTPTSG